MSRLRCGNVPFEGSTIGAYSETTPPPPSTIASASRSWARGNSRPWPPPMNAMVGLRSATAAAWAAPSIPTARPETTVASARASAVPIRLAIRRPAGLGRRVPTTPTTWSFASAAERAADEQAPAARCRWRAGGAGTPDRPARRRGAPRARSPPGSTSRRSAGQRRSRRPRLPAIARPSPSSDRLAATSAAAPAFAAPAARTLAGDPSDSTSRPRVSGPSPWTESSTASASRSARDMAAARRGAASQSAIAGRVGSRSNAEHRLDRQRHGARSVGGRQRAASSRCSISTAGASARSATVLATRRSRSVPRPDSSSASARSASRSLAAESSPAIARRARPLTREFNRPPGRASCRSRAAAMRAATTAERLRLRSADHHRGRHAGERDPDVDPVAERPGEPPDVAIRHAASGSCSGPPPPA